MRVEPRRQRLEPGERRRSAAPATVIAFSVSDTGIGITPDDAAAHLRGLRPGRRHDRAPVRRHRARACRSAASWCGCSAARSRSTSTPERGQHVHRLPAASAAGAATPVPRVAGAVAQRHRAAARRRPPAGRRAPAWPGMKVLVVDDDFRNIFALTALLERGDLEVVSAESGEEGIAMLERTPDIDIVLVDIMMPVMDGYATMRAMRKLPRGARPADRRVHREGRGRASASAASTRAPRPTSPSPSTRRRAPARPRRVAARRRAATGRRCARDGRSRTVDAPGEPARRRSWSSTTTRPSASRCGDARAAGPPVVEADSGAPRCAPCCAQTFAVILMDVRMPTHGRLRDGQADPPAQPSRR